MIASSSSLRRELSEVLLMQEFLPHSRITLRTGTAHLFNTIAATMYAVLFKQALSENNVISVVVSRKFTIFSLVAGFDPLLFTSPPLTCSARISAIFLKRSTFVSTG